MPAALIIGAGSRVGKSTADAFAKAGYSIALASRSDKAGSPDKHFTFDASKPETVKDLFNNDRKSIGVPSVVVYNAYSDHLAEGVDSDQIDLFQSDMNVNATSVWVSAGEAIKGFEEILGGGGATFIFTGNLFNTTVAPRFLTFGMGKSASAHLIQHLALVAYNDKPYKFYYGDQRNADGSPMYTGLSGPAHADQYLKLAQDPKQGPWLQTFVEGKGYVEFPRPETWAPGQ
ncbi:hypothetical protein PV08_00853 [Exophiala spinifera]|uniref:Short-chain dehydrogenase n=1 Tax=Exophiala spinifera TaxID=91928 RepID=A0A0D2BMV6_9EURO|nr:uncharacterized protein PV08_00853 [Exophiala spinifera]KIW20278.1 hypothetical protein PV08_00853 [Exophiala spinifera]